MSRRRSNIEGPNEHATRRRMIDPELVAAGWNVGPGGKSNDEVGQEVPLTTLPTESGAGFADYVLFGDDGKPLAVVEAKRIGKDAQQGAAQAKLYADACERELGARPVVFFTNGAEIYLWNDLPDRASSRPYGEPYRQVRGYYSKKSLDSLHSKHRNRLPLADIAPDLAIAGRTYQLEAVRTVCEHFSTNRRKALIVQATGTGKTRVAVSLCDVLVRAGWVNRILFLCDRKELRKQADGVFKQFMPDATRVIVRRETASDLTKRFYLATYPAMMKCHEAFDIGFFDLVIADESHRSLYGEYRVLFERFDALQVGLTATPVNLDDHDTYVLFDCKEREPTFRFEFEEALAHDPPVLVPFRVRRCESVFRKEGIHYDELDADQRKQLATQVAAPKQLDVAPKDVDRKVFNAAITRNVWRTLMDEGIREATGTRVGKTIVFARNHDHAVHLEQIFSELYPQYGSTFCQVIDNETSHAESRIDDFKVPGHTLTIAISVDMLDTGIDVPEVVNLVFAKAVKSPVKLQQMLGRGTRLCKDLFGPGRDKTEFLVFDHGGNLEHFRIEARERTASSYRPLMVRLFEARLALAREALEHLDEPLFQAVIALVRADVRELLATQSFEVRDQQHALAQLTDEGLLGRFDPVTQADLRRIASPLQHLRNIRGHEDAYGLDLRLTQLQLALLQGGPDSSAVADLRAQVQNAVVQLPRHLEVVRAKGDALKKVRSKDYWAKVTPLELEELRTEIRGIMQYQQSTGTQPVVPIYIDVEDRGFTSTEVEPVLDGLRRIEYKRRVAALLRDDERFSHDPTVQRVRAGLAVEPAELEGLAGRLHEVDERADPRRLVGAAGGEGERSLLEVFRSLVGLDAGVVEQAFAGFVQRHPQLGALQLRFLRELQGHIINNGGIEVERLYERPFTDLHPESVDGLFAEADADEIIALVREHGPSES